MTNENILERYSKCIRLDGKKNCPNCGMPIESEKCPYCGTLFVDFGCIDADEIFFIKIKKNDVIHILKVRLNEIVHYSGDPTTFYADNETIATYSSHETLEMKFDIL